MDINIYMYTNKLQSHNEVFPIPPSVDYSFFSKHKKRRYHNQLGHKKFLRRFRALCCCIGAGGGRSTSVALSDTAKAFHTIFSDLDLVTTDILAGLVLLHKDQKRKKQECKCPVCVDVSIHVHVYSSKDRYMPVQVLPFALHTCILYLQSPDRHV